MISALATPATYNGFSRLAAPAIDLWLLQRRRQGKEDKLRFAERLGRPGRARPDGRLAWAHAASVGESLAVLPLAERLNAEGLNVLITSGTVTSARVLANRLTERMLPQYVPIDRPAPFSPLIDDDSTTRSSTTTSCKLIRSPASPSPVAMTDWIEIESSCSLSVSSPEKSISTAVPESGATSTDRMTRL